MYIFAMLEKPCSRAEQWLHNEFVEVYCLTLGEAAAACIDRWRRALQSRRLRCGGEGGRVGGGRINQAQSATQRHTRADTAAEAAADTDKAFCAWAYVCV